LIIKGIAAAAAETRSQPRPAASKAVFLRILVSVLIVSLYPEKAGRVIRDTLLMVRL
jgi:hypothetical protein